MVARNISLAYNDRMSRSRFLFTPVLLEDLLPNEVFCFGSNGGGFHGGGAAGYAMRGGANKKNWRYDEEFKSIVDGTTTDKRGRWAVFGQARGLQEGHEGKSWGIVTVERPGMLGYVTLRSITKEFSELFQFADNRQDLRFYVTKMGLSREWGGLSFFEMWQMQAVFTVLHATKMIPDNVVLPQEFDPRGSDVAKRFSEALIK